MCHHLTRQQRPLQLWALDGSCNCSCKGSTTSSGKLLPSNAPCHNLRRMESATSRLMCVVRTPELSATAPAKAPSCHGHKSSCKDAKHYKNVVGLTEFATRRRGDLQRILQVFLKYLILSDGLLTAGMPAISRESSY